VTTARSASGSSASNSARYDTRASARNRSSDDNIIIRRYDPTTDIEDNTPFFSGNAISSACGIGVGSVNRVYDMEMTPDGKLVFLTLSVSCLTGFDSAVLIINGPTG